MFNDIYSKYIPKHCPNETCNAFWNVQGLSEMIAVALKDCIMIECKKCGGTYYIYLDENGQVLKKSEKDK